MAARQRSALAFSLILIGVGLWFLTVEVSPPIRDVAYGRWTWPIPIVGIGVFLALAGLLTWTLGWLIPASVVAGTGLLLYWQNLTGQWRSWAYAWTLIPGFVAVGLLLIGLLGRRPGAVIGAGWTLLASLVLFGVFGSFLGGWDILARLWPALLIAAGVLLLSLSLLRRPRER